MFAMPAAGSSPSARYTLNKSAVLLRCGPRMRSCAGRTVYRTEADRYRAGGNARVSPIAKPLAANFANPSSGVQAGRSKCNPAIVRARANGPFHQTFQVKLRE